jgi:hypothetical protein
VGGNLLENVHLEDREDDKSDVKINLREICCVDGRWVELPEGLFQKLLDSDLHEIYRRFWKGSCPCITGCSVAS